ncbi:hypothetical protein H0O02_03520 [Candidatus Micrarchaeota archaeon]|nr:hypothetical protein [Candidatus Micrarchaeota archaeon]
MKEDDPTGEYDFRKLCDLGFRIKTHNVAEALTKARGHQSSAEFIRKYSLNVSKNTLNNWLNLEYGIPLDMAINILGWKRLKELEINTLSSGRASSYRSAVLPTKPNLPLMYLIGATIGDGSLRHEADKSYFESYFVSFEMADKEVLSLIRDIFQKVFALKKPIRIIRRKDGRKTYLLKYSNKVVYYFLNRFFGLGPRKTKTVGIEGLKKMSRDQKLALLLGLYHTDGSITNGNLRFYTSSEKLKEDTRFALRDLGYNSSTYTYKRKNYSPEYQTSVIESENFISELQNMEAILSQKSI